MHRLDCTRRVLDWIFSYLQFLICPHNSAFPKAWSNTILLSKIKDFIGQDQVSTNLADEVTQDGESSRPSEVVWVPHELPFQLPMQVGYMVIWELICDISLLFWVSEYHFLKAAFPEKLQWHWTGLLHKFHSSMRNQVNLIRYKIELRFLIL